VPLSSVTGSIESEARSFLRVEGPGAGSVVVEAVKLAEDSNDVVVRLYESEGRGAKVLLVAGFPIRDARVSNMLEEPSGPLEMNDVGITLEFRPFEIRTVILRL
jgi:alpha-mannosidase